MYSLLIIESEYSFISFILNLDYHFLFLTTYFNEGIRFFSFRS